MSAGIDGDFQAVVNRCRASIVEFLREFTSRGMALDEAVSIWKTSMHKMLKSLDATDPQTAEVYLGFDEAILAGAIDEYRSQEGEEVCFL